MYCPLYMQCFIHKIQFTRSVRIFHKNQFDQEGECYNCFKTDHQSRNCPNEKACRVCKEPGHDPGPPNCIHYTAKVDVMAIGGYPDPLSSHYKAPFMQNHIPAKTVENHWFYNKSNKNGQPELATCALMPRMVCEPKAYARASFVPKIGTKVSWHMSTSMSPC